MRKKIILGLFLAIILQGCAGAPISAPISAPIRTYTQDEEVMSNFLKFKIEKVSQDANTVVVKISMLNMENKPRSLVYLLTDKGPFPFKQIKTYRFFLQNKDGNTYYCADGIDQISTFSPRIKREGSLVCNDIPKDNYILVVGYNKLHTDDTAYPVPTETLEFITFQWELGKLGSL